ncbi:TPA: hypothetical protein ACG4TC_002200 [Staphylococcus aureus]
MRKIMRTLLCTSIIVSGCSFIPKNQTKDIPKTVSVKDYDGQYIGEHKKRNEVFLKKHKGDAFNQQLQNLINKYPEIKKSMKYDFIAYYDKDENRETVANYVWNLQKTTNDTMKLHPGNKSIIFYKDKVSASQLDEHKRLQSDSQEISISGGENN